MQYLVLRVFTNKKCFIWVISIPMFQVPSQTVCLVHRYFSKLFSSKQLINDCTRKSITCSTVIDLIMTTDVGKVSQSGTISCGLSDHKFVFFLREKSVKVKFWVTMLLKLDR